MAFRAEEKNSEFISGLNGKSLGEISSGISKEIERLSNLEEMKSSGNYDKKKEISSLISKLKEYESLQKIKNNSFDTKSETDKLKRVYKLEDSAFNASVNGTKIDDRPAKFKEEIDRLNSSLDELKKKKEEALSNGNKKLADFYSTLEFNRGMRQSELKGRLNKLLLARSMAEEAEQARKSDPQRMARDTQKVHSRIISLHERR